MKHIIKIICLAWIANLIAILLWSVQWDYPQCDIIRLPTNQNEKTQRWDVTIWDDVHVPTGCFEQLREMREFLPYRTYKVQSIKQISFDDELSLLALAILITAINTTNLLIIYSMLDLVLGSLHLI